MFTLGQFFSAKKARNSFIFLIFLYVTLGFFTTACNKKKPKQTFGRYGSDLRETAKKQRLYFNIYTVIDEQDQKQIYFPFENLRSSLADFEKHQAIFRGQHKASASGQYLESHPAMYPSYELVDSKIPVFVLSEPYFSDLSEGLLIFDVLQKESPVADYEMTDAFFFEKNYANGRTYHLKQGTRVNTRLRVLTGEVLDRTLAHQGKEQIIGLKTFIFIDSYDEDYQHGITALGSETENILVVLRNKTDGKLVYEAGTIRNARVELDVLLQDYTIEMLMGGSGSLRVSEVVEISNKPVKFLYEDLQIAKYFGTHEEDTEIGRIDIEAKKIAKFLPTSNQIKVHYQKITPTQKAISELDGIYSEGMNYLVLPKKPTELECGTGISFIETGLKDYWIVPQKGQIQCLGDKYEALLNNLIIYQKLKNDTERRIGVVIDITDDNTTGEEMRNVKTLTPPGLDVKGATIRKIYISQNATVAIGQVPPTLESYWWSQEVANQKTHAIDGDVKIFVRSYDKKKINVYHINYELLISSGELDFIWVGQEYGSTYKDPVRNFLDQVTPEADQKNKIIHLTELDPEEELCHIDINNPLKIKINKVAKTLKYGNGLVDKDFVQLRLKIPAGLAVFVQDPNSGQYTDLLEEEINLENSRLKTVKLDKGFTANGGKLKTEKLDGTACYYKIDFLYQDDEALLNQANIINTDNGQKVLGTVITGTIDTDKIKFEKTPPISELDRYYTINHEIVRKTQDSPGVLVYNDGTKVELGLSPFPAYNYNEGGVPKKIDQIVVFSEDRENQKTYEVEFVLASFVEKIENLSVTQKDNISPKFSVDLIKGATQNIMGGVKKTLKTITVQGVNKRLETLGEKVFIHFDLPKGAKYSYEDQNNYLADLPENGLAVENGKKIYVLSEDTYHLAEHELKFEYLADKVSPVNVDVISTNTRSKAILKKTTDIVLNNDRYVAKIVEAEFDKGIRVQKFVFKNLVNEPVSALSFEETTVTTDLDKASFLVIKNNESVQNEPVYFYAEDGTRYPFYVELEFKLDINFLSGNISTNSVIRVNHLTKNNFIELKNFVSKGWDLSKIQVVLKLNNQEIKDNFKDAFVNYQNNDYQLTNPFLEKIQDVWAKLPISISQSISCELSLLDESGRVLANDQTNLFNGINEIHEIEDLKNLAIFPNQNYKLTTSFDLKNQDFSPIEHKKLDGTIVYFNGTLDGNQKVLSSFKISRTTTNKDKVGLFAELGEKSVVKNLRLADFTVQGNEQVGTLAGVVKGHIEALDIFNTNVEGNKNVGALLGLYQNVANNIFVQGIEVKEAKISGNQNVAGLIGELQNGTVQYNKVEIKELKGTSNLGGIIGLMDNGKATHNTVHYYGNNENVNLFIGQSNTNASLQNTYGIGITNQLFPVNIIVSDVVAYHQQGTSATPVYYKDKNTKQDLSLLEMKNKIFELVLPGNTTPLILRNKAALSTIIDANTQIFLLEKDKKIYPIIGLDQLPTLWWDGNATTTSILTTLTDCSLAGVTFSFSTDSGVEDNFVLSPTNYQNLTSGSIEITVTSPANYTYQTGHLQVSSGLRNQTKQYILEDKQPAGALQLKRTDPEGLSCPAFNILVAGASFGVELKQGTDLFFGAPNSNDEIFFAQKFKSNVSTFGDIKYAAGETVKIKRSTGNTVTLNSPYTNISFIAPNDTLKEIHIGNNNVYKLYYSFKNDLPKLEQVTIIQNSVLLNTTTIPVGDCSVYDVQNCGIEFKNLKLGAAVHLRDVIVELGTSLTNPTLNSQLVDGQETSLTNFTFTTLENNSIKITSEDGSKTYIYPLVLKFDDNKVDLIVKNPVQNTVNGLTAIIENQVVNNYVIKFSKVNKRLLETNPVTPVMVDFEIPSTAKLYYNYVPMATNVWDEVTDLSNYNVRDGEKFKVLAMDNLTANYYTANFVYMNSNPSINQVIFQQGATNIPGTITTDKKVIFRGLSASENLVFGTHNPAISVVESTTTWNLYKADNTLVGSSATLPVSTTVIENGMYIKSIAEDGTEEIYTIYLEYRPAISLAQKTISAGTIDKNIFSFSGVENTTYEINLTVDGKTAKINKTPNTNKIVEFSILDFIDADPSLSWKDIADQDNLDLNFEIKIGTFSLGTQIEKVNKKQYLLSFADDVSGIRHNLAGTYTLNNSISNIVLDQPLASGNEPFSGKINGDGHTLTYTLTNGVNNLYGLFAKTEGAEITALNVQVNNLGVANNNNAKVGGLIAEAKNTKISMVGINTSNLKGYLTGGLVAELSGTSVIEHSSVINTNMNAQNAGGLVGYAKEFSIIRYNYASNSELKAGAGLIYSVDNSVAVTGCFATTSSTSNLPSITVNTNNSINFKEVYGLIYRMNQYTITEMNSAVREYKQNQMSINDFHNKIQAIKTPNIINYPNPLISLAANKAVFGLNDSFNLPSIVPSIPFQVLWWQGGDISDMPTKIPDLRLAFIYINKNGIDDPDNLSNYYKTSTDPLDLKNVQNGQTVTIFLPKSEYVDTDPSLTAAHISPRLVDATGNTMTISQSPFDSNSFVVVVESGSYSASYNIKVIFVKDLITELKVRQNSIEYSAQINLTTGEISFPNVRFAPNSDIEIVSMKAGAGAVQTAKLIYQDNSQIEVSFTNQNANLSTPLPKFTKNNPIVIINGGTEQRLVLEYKEDQVELLGFQVSNDGPTYNFKRVSDQSKNLYFDNLDLTKSLKVSAVVNTGSTWVFGTWNQNNSTIEEITADFIYNKTKSYRLKITAEDGLTSENFVVHFINRLSLSKASNTPNQFGLKDLKTDYFILTGLMVDEINIELNYKTDPTQKYTQNLNKEDKFSVFDLLLDTPSGMIKKVEDGGYELKASYNYLLDGAAEFVPVATNPQELQLALRNIKDAEDFVNMYLMNYSGIDYELQNTINIELKNSLFNTNKPFLANFNGNNKQIQYLAAYTGNIRTLFGATTNATIKDIILSPSFGTETVNTAGLVGVADGGFLENIQVNFDNSKSVSGSEIGGLILEAKGNVQIKKSFVNNLVVKDVTIFGALAAKTEQSTLEGFWANVKIESTNNFAKLGFLIGQKTGNRLVNLTGAYTVMRNIAENAQIQNIIGDLQSGTVNYTKVYGLVSNAKGDKTGAVGYVTSDIPVQNIGVLDIKKGLVGVYGFLKPTSNWINFYNDLDNLPQFEGSIGGDYGDTRIKGIVFKGLTNNIAPSSMILSEDVILTQNDLVGLEKEARIKVYQTLDQLTNSFDPKNPEHLVITRNSNSAVETLPRKCSGNSELQNCTIEITDNGDKAIYYIDVIIPALEIDKIVITQNNVDITLEKINPGLFRGKVKETYSSATIKSINMIGGVIGIEFNLHLGNGHTPVLVKNIVNGSITPENTTIYDATSNKKLEKISVGSIETIIELEVLSSNTSLEGITMSLTGNSGSSTDEKTLFAGTNTESNHRYFINAHAPNSSGNHTLRIGLNAFKGELKIYENYGLVDKQTEVVLVNEVYTLSYAKNGQYTMELTSADGAKKQVYPLHIYPRIQATIGGHGVIENNKYRTGLGDIAKIDFLELVYLTPPNETNQKIDFTGTGTSISSSNFKFGLKDMLQEVVWKTNDNSGSQAALDLSLSSTILNINCGATANCNKRIIDISLVQGTLMQIENGTNNSANPKLNLKLDIPNIKNIYDLKGLSVFEDMITATLYPTISGTDSQKNTIQPISFKGNVVGEKVGNLDDSYTNLTTISNLIIDCTGVASCGIFKELPKSVKHLYFNQISVSNTTNKSNVGILAGTATIDLNIHADGGNPIVQNVVIKNSTITGENNIGTFIGEVKGATNNKTILSHVISSANEITGNSAVGGLVGKTTGGIYTILGALADVVTVNASKGGLLFGEATGTTTNVFKLNNVQAIGTLKGNGSQIGGAIGLISNNNAGAAATVLERIITLPKFDGFTKTFVEKKVGLFAGEFSGAANQNGSNNGFQNHRIYSSPSVGTLSLDGNTVKLKNATRNNEERGWMLKTNPLLANEIYAVSLSGAPYSGKQAPWSWYHTSAQNSNLVQENDKRLYTDGTTNINNGLNAPMFFQVDGKTYPTTDDRWHVYHGKNPVGHTDGATYSSPACSTWVKDNTGLNKRKASVFDINTGVPGSCSSTPLASGVKYEVKEYVTNLSLTYNSFPLKKFGSEPISEVVSFNHPYVTNLYNNGKVELSQSPGGSVSCETADFKNFYAYLNHGVDILAQMGPNLSDITGYNTTTTTENCTYLKNEKNIDRTQYQFESLKTSNRLWRDNYPDESKMAFSGYLQGREPIIPFSKNTVFLNFLASKGFDLKIENDNHQW